MESLGERPPRGITMCAAWRESFAAFYQHIGPRPAGLTLERIKNDLGYQPGNVRWAPVFGFDTSAGGRPWVI